MRSSADAIAVESILSAEADLLGRYPLLNKRDLCAGAITIGAACGMLVSTLAFAFGLAPAWLVVLVNAFLAALLHEVEHDLIHRLYFRSRPWIYHAAMALVWVFRGNLIHGWYRRRLHLLHHRVSGASHDLEERLLGLGLRWGVRRALITLDGSLAFLLNARRLSREIAGFDRRQLMWASVPVYPLYLSVLLGYPGLGWFWPESPLIGWSRVLFVGWALPNLLRQASLVFVSSNIHYVGERLAPSRQVQIWRRWFLWPIQLFCFNFGATHAIHHFVVNQPFYVRQAIARRVTPVLQACGVARDDLGTLARSNRPMTPDPAT